MNGIKLIANIENIKINIICPICNRIITSTCVQCIKCRNYLCQSCFGKFNNKNNDNLCPFKCIKSSFKTINIVNILSLINLDNYNIGIPKKINSNIKDKYINYVNFLKRNKEFENQLNINKNIKSNHLSNCFKSVFHSHNLYNSVLKYEGWICDICEEKFEEKTNGRYRCEECDFDICVKCRKLEESGYKFDNIFLSKSHKHILRDETLKETNWICDVCNKWYEMKTMKRFRCQRCDFDICNNCKVKEIKNPNGFFYNLLISIFYIYFIQDFCNRGI